MKMRGEFMVLLSLEKRKEGYLVQEGEEMKRVDIFKYLGNVIQEMSGGIWK